MSPPRPSLAENPWLWVALFGGMGLLGVMVIGPKYVARWSRVERMQEARERVAMERARREALGPAAVNSEAPQIENKSGTKPTATRPTAMNPEASADSTAGEAKVVLPEPEPYVESDFQQPESLRYLLLFMTLVMLVGTSGLIVTRGRQRRAAELAALEASNSSPAANPSSPPQA